MYKGLYVFIDRMDSDNLFQHTLSEMHHAAPVALVDTLKTQMEKIKEKYPHNVTAVEHCMPILEKDPKLLDVLVICYILNGGVLLKHMLEDTTDFDLDEAFLNDLDWKL